MRILGTAAVTGPTSRRSSTSFVLEYVFRNSLRASVHVVGQALTRKDRVTRSS